MIMRLTAPFAHSALHVLQVAKVSETSHLVVELADALESDQHLPAQTCGPPEPTFKPRRRPAHSDPGLVEVRGEDPLRGLY